MTSFQLSQFSLPDSMDSEVTPSKRKSKKKPKKEKTEKSIKTIKMRLFPSEEEKNILQPMFDQFRWYYNATLSIFYKHYGYENILNKSKYSKYTSKKI